MKTKLMALATAGLLAGAAQQAQAQEVLQGDERTACEAVLCLAAGGGPSECSPPLRRYFSITARKPSDLRRKRRDFLNMCPNQDQAMIEGIVNGQCNPDYQQCGGGGGGGDGGRPVDPDTPILIR